MPDEAEYLTVAQFAGRTGLSRQEVYKLIWAGKIPCTYFGRSPRIPAVYLAYKIAVALAGGASQAAAQSNPDSLAGEAAAADAAPLAR
jgi:excisionase family DNA binding protein